MTPPRHVNDGSSREPRLSFFGNDWAMSEMPRRPAERDWSFEETADRLMAAGFEGVQSGSRHHIRAIRTRGLRYAASARVNSEEEIERHVREAADDGADCSTLHLGWGTDGDERVDRLVHAVLEKSHQFEVPIYIETHRATVAQDLVRIARFLSRFPEVRFNGDFSHLYCGGEVPYRGFEANLPFFEPVLRRVCFLHGRISNGHSMQIDVGDGKSNAHARHFVTLWRKAMDHWRRGARNGDLLPFAPELGPPSGGYSISYIARDGRMTEISDRWEQSLVIKRLAEEAWGGTGEVGAGS